MPTGREKGRNADGRAVSWSTYRLTSKAENLPDFGYHDVAAELERADADTKGDAHGT